MKAGIPAVDEVFEQAIRHAPGSDRSAFLDEACGTDADLRQRVDRLLKAFAEAGSFLETPAVPVDPTIDLPLPILPGTQIGPYKLLQQIGEGGMGVVYLAEQTQPVQRKVALKIIKPGMDSRQVIARFEAERQALAMMDHVNIARVIDGGTIYPSTIYPSGGRQPPVDSANCDSANSTTSSARGVDTPRSDAGRPYFVMELIHGVPITKYCDDQHLTPRERLELFVPVCQAIQHAHQKGIIHRDIKPSNVLVTLYDGKPVPKVIDFGVAKAIDQKLTDNTLFTNFGTMVGTLEYMSPEQAEINNLGVDTRSDIYSLGVLLYELLTGSTPLTRKRLKEAANLEIFRMIKEEEPQKPSTRLSESGDKLASISAQRNMEPAKLSKLVRGELDWIVMKTLEKDRNRRYETANGLGRDIQRYLADEMVEARPPTLGYRVRKFVTRNKGSVLAASLLMFSLIAGVIGTSWQAFRAEQQRNRALGAEKVAKNNEELAKQSQADTEAFSDFLVLDVLSAARPKDLQGGLGIGVTVIKALETAQLNLEKRFAGRPLAEATAHDSIGRTWRILADFNRAEKHLRQAIKLRQKELGPAHSKTLESCNSLGVLLYQTDRYDEAIELLNETFKIRKATFGPDNPQTLISMCNLAQAYGLVGQPDKQLLLCQEAVERLQTTLSPNHPDTLKGMFLLANSLEDVGQHGEALKLHEKTLALRQAILGPDHLDTLVSQRHFAKALSADGKLDQVLPLLKQIWEIRQAKLGPDHKDTLDSLNDLGLAYLNADKPEQALPLLRKVAEKRNVKLGPDHSDSFQSLNNIAMAYLGDGKPEQAAQILEMLLEQLKTKSGFDHPHTLIAMDNLARSYLDSGKLDQAIKLHEKTLRIRMEKLGDNHPQTFHSMNNLAVAYMRAGNFALALPLFEQAWERQKSRLGNEHVDTLNCMSNLSDCYEKISRLSEAESLRRELVNIFKMKTGADSPQYTQQLAFLGHNLSKQQKYHEAEIFLKDCLKIRDVKEPDDWKTFNSKSILGGSLFGQKKYDEAEPLLLIGYEGMKLREKKIPPSGKSRLTDAGERIIQFYEATGKKDKAEEWRKKVLILKTTNPTNK